MMARAISNVLFLSTMAILVDCFIPPVLRPPTTTSRAPRVKMATAKADVCRGDVPTPGWVRLAQRNLSKIRVGDPLPDACVRYAAGGSGVPPQRGRAHALPCRCISPSDTLDSVPNLTTVCGERESWSCLSSVPLSPVFVE